MLPDVAEGLAFCIIHLTYTRRGIQAMIGANKRNTFKNNTYRVKKFMLCCAPPGPRIAVHPSTTPDENLQDSMQMSGRLCMAEAAKGGNESNGAFGSCPLHFVLCATRRTAALPNMSRPQSECNGVVQPSGPSPKETTTMSQAQSLTEDITR